MRTINDLENIAIKKGWILNPNEKVVKNILKLQNKNKKQFGEYYCPCKKEHIPENICPCNNAQNEINTYGHCHCNLFYPKT